MTSRCSRTPIYSLPNTLRSNAVPKVYVDDVSKQTPRKRKVATKKVEKKKAKTIVTVSVHNKIIELSKKYPSGDRSYHPVCLMLGADKEGVIHKLQPLLNHKKYTCGCREMTRINELVMLDAYLKLAKKGLIACGVIRIGEFKHGTDFGDRGASLLEVGRYGGIIISSSSCSKPRIWSERYTIPPKARLGSYYGRDIKRCEKLEYCVIKKPVLKSKMKEVKKSCPVKRKSKSLTVA